MTGYVDLSPIIAKDKFVDISKSDKAALSQVAFSGVYLAIENADQLNRIARYTTNGDIVQAFEDVIEKGIRELIALCDMDDAMERENTEVKE